MILDAPCGQMEGLEKGGLAQFLGIPYAKPPVGALRFRPTEALPRWEGVRTCTKPGRAAPQLCVPGLTSLRKEETLDEDCLYLNVTTPDVHGHAPVLFWIHAGAFQKGSGTLGIQPETFAKKGLVVVNGNYRLGALGFLDVSRWFGDDYRQSGNNGLLDILQALRWTQDNIAAFGGDPDNITVMGQSAGAKICGTLTLMQAARGLFRRAVLCSGAVQCIRSRHTAQTIADRFLAEAGLTDADASELLTMPWERLLKAQTNLFAGLNLHTVGPVFDGVNFGADDALALVRNGAGRDVDLLIGTNRDEMNLYWHVYNVHGLDDALAVKLFGSRAPIVMNHYAKIPRDENFHRNFIHFFTEYVYRSGSLKMAEAAAEAGQRVYLYRLDWDRQAFGACHASETQFLMGFGSVIRDVDRSPAHEALAEEMRGAFLQFIRTGVPAAEGLPPWPAFGGERRAMMAFDAPCRVERAPASEVDPRMPYPIFELD